MSVLADRSAVVNRTEVTRTFFNQVYLWMGLALVLTAVMAVFVANTPAVLAWVVGSEVVFYGLLIAELLLVIVLSATINRMSAVMAYGVFFLYAALNGITFSVILLAFTATSIGTTFLVTAATFGTMSVLGYTTRRDLSGLGGLLSMALIGLIIASVVNLFWADSTLYWLITYAGVLIFVGLTAYDTQKLKAMATNVDTESGQKAAVLGALALYLDFINLFLMLLRIMGRRR
jgi:uncharacterized protein